MKNFLLKSSLLCILAAAFLSCDKDFKAVGDFNLSIKEVGPDYVDLFVTAPSTVEMAYMLTTDVKAVSAAVLFMTGETQTVNPGDVIKLNKNLQSKTAYRIYAAAKLDEQNYSKVVSVEFETKEFNFDKLLSVVETKHDGYRVHITVPQSTKEAGNVIRYSAASAAMFNVVKNNTGDEGYHILQSVIANGNRHGNYAKNDTTLLRDNSNIVVMKDGEPVLDSEGNQIDIHDPITPGEPTIFLAGECRWGSDEEMGAITKWYYGVKDSAYVVPLFDWDTVDASFDWSITERDNWVGSGWTGAFQKLVFRTKEPGLCDATVNIEIPEDEITVTGANVYFDMDDEVSRYVYMILDNATYNGVVDQYLDKKGAPQDEIDREFQWFLTSWLAFYEWGIGAYTEDTQVNAASFFNDGVLMGGETYHVLCTVMVDDPTLKDNPDNAANQRFIHKTFKAKEKTKPAPIIKIKAIEAPNAYEAAFNIKAPNKDLEGAYMAANYSREFQLMLNAGYTYETLLKGNYQFKTEEIKAINSDAGYDIYFDSLDGEEMRLAVYGCNDEYTFNIIDKKVEGDGWADCQVPMAPKAERINSPLYDALVGDWTATATAKINETDADGNVVSRKATLTSKVTISREIPNMPDAVGQDIYDLYESLDYDNEEVDAMFDELTTLTDRFDEYRIQGQNRLLCSGFLDYDYYENGRMSYKSPYDLFCDKDYNSVDVPQLVYDFGPKWFLQINSDGTVTVPFSTEYLPPMHSWPGYPFYIGGVADVAFLDQDGATPTSLPGFPVEVSSDYKKITIKPVVNNGTPYYMNAVGVADGSYELISTILSEIVLTKGWDASSSKTSTKAVLPNVTPAKVNCVAAPPKAKVYKSVADFSKMAPVKTFKVDETPNIVTMEMVNKTTDRILEYYNVK